MPNVKGAMLPKHVSFVTNLRYDANTGCWNWTACHRCDNPACFNPKHLFIGTDSDNQIDRVSKRRHNHAIKTHCKHGHPLSGDNLMINSVKGSRQCKTCRNAWNNAYRRRLGIPAFDYVNHQKDLSRHRKYIGPLLGNGRFFSSPCGRAKRLELAIQ